MFKIFPGTFTSDNRKVPIKEVKWKEDATVDQTIINNWAQLHSHKIKFWAIPTGVENGPLVMNSATKLKMM